MRKIQDRLVLAGVGALIGAWPIRVLSRYLYQRRLIDFNIDELGAGLFLTERAARTPLGRVSGIVTNEINYLLASALVVYVLSVTGRDKPVLKGAGVGLTMWVWINGLLSGSVLRKKAAKPATPLYNLLHHLLSGSLCGYVVARLGDDSLFPDMKIRTEHGKLPVAALGGE